MESLDFFFLVIYLFIFIWLHRVLIVAHGIFELCYNVGDLRFQLWDLVPSPRVEPRPRALGE